MVCQIVDFCCLLCILSKALVISCTDVTRRMWTIGLHCQILLHVRWALKQEITRVVVCGDWLKCLAVGSCYLYCELLPKL